ncbi:MAG: CdaR family protein [Lachnospiraceae bacterium]|nr:CdaR family protein [Lachnospiraceae bacterium]
MKKIMLNNPGLKGLALVIAIVLWLIIVNVNDPVKTRTIYNVPLMVENGSYIESMGESYRLGEGFDTISVRVRGNRSAVENMTPSSITARIDLTEIVSMESSPIQVPIHVAAPGVTLAEITPIPGTARIDLEEMMSRDFLVNCDTGDTKPAVGYEVAKLTPEQETISISGPGSILDIIDTVQATVDVSGIAQDTVRSGNVVIYDKNGSALTDTQMSYLRFDSDISRMVVNVSLYRVVTGVELTVEGYTGHPAANYQVKNIAVVPAEVAVAGSEDELRAIEEAGNKIVLDPSLIDVSGKKNGFDIRIDDFSSLLPGDLHLTGGTSGAIVISVDILPYNSTAVHVPTEQVTLLNVPKGLKVLFDKNDIEVAVKGSDAALESLAIENISISIDCAGLEAGSHTLNAVVTLPDNYSLAQTVTVSVKLEAA